MGEYQYGRALRAAPRPRQKLKRRREGKTMANEIMGAAAALHSADDVRHTPAPPTHATSFELLAVIH